MSNVKKNMAAKKYADELPILRKVVERWFEGFSDNIKSYQKFRQFVFHKQLTDVEEQRLASIGKPPLQFNIIEPYQSRMRGEFSEQEPTIYVGVKDYLKNNQEYAQLVKTAEYIEGHIRYIIEEANINGCAYDVFSEQISGGFSVHKIWTEYEGPKSFQQVIKMGKTFDPTLCGFDLMARKSHKGDGNHYFEIYPKTKEDFKREYPQVDVDEIYFSKTGKIEGFEWSYSNDNDDIILVCDFYKKKKRKVKIVELADKRVMTEDEYNEALEQWNQQQIIVQPPIIKNSRETEFTTICRYVFIENKMLSYEETDFSELPGAFVDNNSAQIREVQGGMTKQITRPFFYNAMDVQRLKNFAGQTLASDIENMVQQKWKIAIESIHNDWQDWIKYPQIPAPAIYSAFMDGEPDKAIPPPMEIQRTSTPPEVLAAFTMAEQTLQSILGSYDSAFANNELSGRAIVEAETKSNASSKPSVVGYIQSLNQIGKGIMDLIPKYLFDHESIPILDKAGEKKYVNVNGEGQPNLKYDPSKFNLSIEAGVNFEIQKARTIDWIVKLAGAMPGFAEFMHAKGLDTIVDNLPIKGADQLRVLAKEYKKELEQKQQQAAQMAQQQAMQNPAMQKVQLEQAKLQHQTQQDQIKNQLAASQQQLDEFKAETDRIKLRMIEQENHINAIMSADKLQTEKIRANADTVVALTKHGHEHQSDIRTHEREDLRLHHDIHQANKKEKENAKP